MDRTFGTINMPKVFAFVYCLFNFRALVVCSEWEGGQLWISDNFIIDLSYAINWKSKSLGYFKCRKKCYYPVLQSFIQ